MREIMEVYRGLLGREPTEQELQRLLLAKSVLGIRNNDAMLLILIAFENYKALYESIPGKIKEATEVTAKKASEQASEQVKKETNKIINDLVPAISDKLLERAKEVEGGRRKEIKWLAIGIILLAAGIIYGMITGFYYGILYNTVKEGVEYFLLAIARYTILGLFVMICFLTTILSEYKEIKWLGMAGTIIVIIITILIFMRG